jgi:hypothetical protein
MRAVRCAERAPEIMHRTGPRRQQGLAPLESGVHSPHIRAPIGFMDSIRRTT